MGVWIETEWVYVNSLTLTSLLMWECGLKPPTFLGRALESSSLLMWECGLKLACSFYLSKADIVTPYVGVWIETILYKTI